jgi:DNA polymerase elongation subunit (family B)
MSNDGPAIWVYDVESSPNLCWTFGLWDQNIGINQSVQSQDILTFAAHKIGTKKIETMAAWDDYDAMIARLHEIFSEADYLVGYSNASFDDKMVRAAFVKAGLEPPAPHRVIDLLRVVKRNFKFPSHKLDYVCGALGLEHKASTGGMDLWTACMAGDVKAQKKMLAYNRQDTKITTDLFNRLLPYCGLNVPLHSDEDDAAAMLCTKCGSDHVTSRGFAYTTGSRYRRYQCQSCMG